MILRIGIYAQRNSGGVTTLVPGDGTTSWTDTNGVTTTLGKIVPSSTAIGWDKAGAFGVLTDDTSGELNFDLVYMSGKSSGGIAMFGFTTDPTLYSHSKLNHCFYFSYGFDVIIRELGTDYDTGVSWSAGDSFQIKVVGNLVKYYINGVWVYDSPTSVVADLYFDCSINRYLGAENLEIVY